MGVVVKQFEKDGVVRSFEIYGDKVATYIVVDGVTICNPTMEQFLADGWVEYIPPIPPVPEPVLPTIEQLVEGKLRERYSINQEFEVNRKRETEPLSFAAYYDYVEECIAWAEEQPHRKGV